MTNNLSSLTDTMSPALSTNPDPLLAVSNLLTNHPTIPSLLEIVRDNQILLNLLFSLLSVTLFWLARYILLRVVWYYTEDASIRYRWRKASSYVTLGLNIIIISQIWIHQFNNLLTYLGLVSAGIAIAMKDMVANFLGWIFIVSSKPFAVGDRIQIGTLSGDVIDIKAFYFTVMEIGNWVAGDQSTGRIVHVPNGQLFIQHLSNYTKAFHYIWHEIQVPLTYRSDWQLARRLLTDLLESRVGQLSRDAEKKIRDASRQFMIYYSTLAPAVYLSTNANGIVLTLRYLCEAKQRRVTENLLWEDILSTLPRQKNIRFSFSTISLADPAAEQKVSK